MAPTNTIRVRRAVPLRLAPIRGRYDLGYPVGKEMKMGRGRGPLASHWRGPEPPSMSNPRGSFRCRARAMISAKGSVKIAQQLTIVRRSSRPLVGPRLSVMSELGLPTDRCSEG